MRLTGQHIGPDPDPARAVIASDRSEGGTGAWGTVPGVVGRDRQTCYLPDEGDGASEGGRQPIRVIGQRGTIQVGQFGPFLVPQVRLSGETY